MAWDRARGTLSHETRSAALTFAPVCVAMKALLGVEYGREEQNMYGMVNQAVRGLVTSAFGDETWEKIYTQAGSPDTFIDFEQYDDAVTYNLVAASSEVLELDAATVLRTFGNYWVKEVATVRYADLLDRTGTDFLSFLQGLDHMHSRIKVSFPNYQPPSFRVKETSPGNLEVDYYSEREGLLPFVEGLLEGLSKHFDVDITLEHVPDESHPMPCKRMLLSYSAK